LAIKNILFDLDGTLINSLPLIEKTFRRVFAEMQIPWNNGEVLKTIGLPLKQICEQFAGEKKDDCFALFQLYQREEHALLTRIYPGTLEALGELQNRGYTLGLVTSKRRVLVDEELIFTGLSDFFTISVTVNDTVNPKPEPDPVWKALELLKSRPEEAIYIGDSWYDLLSGQRAGVMTAGVTWGMAKREELIKYIPDLLFDTWDQILEYF
jgi:pyrophosphatase PpaX